MQKGVSIFVLQIDMVSFAVEEELKDRQVFCKRAEEQENFLIIVILYLVRSFLH